METFTYLEKSIIADYRSGLGYWEITKKRNVSFSFVHHTISRWRKVIDGV